METKERQLELAILRLMGLFEMPMSPGCFEALRAEPTIAGLTESFGAAETFEVEAAVTTLIEHELLSHGGGDDYIGSLLDAPLDAHPLIREYLALQLQGSSRRRSGRLTRGCLTTCARTRRTNRTL